MLTLLGTLLRRQISHHRDIDLHRNLMGTARRYHHLVDQQYRVQRYLFVNVREDRETAVIRPIYMELNNST